MSEIAQAYRLAEAGRTGEAVATLQSAGSAGSADALVELAVWYLGGRIVPRDLQKTRHLFGAAAKLGHARAAEVYLNFLANGTGGSQQWLEARERLEVMASRDPEAQKRLLLLNAMDLQQTGDPKHPLDAEVLSQSPEVRYFTEFLSADECRYLIERASPTMAPSVVVDPQNGRFIPHPFRTSDNTAFPWVDEDPVIHAINRRIAAATETDVTGGEPLQVLRYRPGQEYRPHHDALPGTDNQRIVTFLLYLNEGYSGGETLFLHNGLRVAGRRGDGLMFRNADDRGRPDPTATHAGCPVTAGEKMLATRWIHQRRFGPL